MSRNLRPGPHRLLPIPGLGSSPRVTYPSQGPDRSPSRSPKSWGLQSFCGSSQGGRSAFSGQHQPHILPSGSAYDRSRVQVNVLRGPAFPVVSSTCGRLGPLSRAELTSWLTSTLNEAQFSMDHHGWARTGHTQAPESPRGDKAGWLAHLSPRKVAPRAITLFHRLPQNWNRAAPRGAVVSLSSHLHRPLALVPSSTPQAAELHA